MNSDNGRVGIRLLGPLSAEFNHRQVTPSAAKQRQVLALLALNAGRVVTVPTLLEELWGDHPPRSYATTLQTYILQLRKALAAASPEDPAARQVLGTRYGGYLLEEGGCQTDVADFARLTGLGCTAHEAGDFRAAAESFGRALRLCRGPALVDVPKGRVLELEAASLEETLLSVLERRMEADLNLGRHTDLLGELTLMAARNPMNEKLCAYLMIALYRSGHVSRALKAFHQIRAVLKEELGVEPCPRLQRLELAILSGDIDLDSAQVSDIGTDRTPARLA
jgi:SARP family transcriptional regulator, regulator of embCAB operon